MSHAPSHVHAHVRSVRHAPYVCMQVRIRMVADPNYASSSLAALGRISREKGPLGSLGGFPAMAAKQVPYTMGKQVLPHTKVVVHRSLTRWASRYCHIRM